MISYIGLHVTFYSPHTLHDARRARVDSLRALRQLSAVRGHGHLGHVVARVPAGDDVRHELGDGHHARVVRLVVIVRLRVVPVQVAFDHVRVNPDDAHARLRELHAQGPRLVVHKCLCAS
jgi:hypothetical protein